MTPPERKTFAVVGASGFVGSAIADELEKRGHLVVKVSAPRLSTKARTVQELRSAALSAGEVENLSEQLRGVNALINAAGVSDATAGGRDDLFGANSLLPVVLVEAAARAGVVRSIHISSAAVQGRSPVLDESTTYTPFSPYSESKALAEQALSGIEGVCAFRPTSVHGASRPVTQALVRLARSPLSSVAGSGDNPTPQVLVTDVAQAVAWCAAHPEPLPGVVLQPWGGMSTAGVLEVLSGRRPVRVPLVVARLAIAGGRVLAHALPRLQGVVRRVEMLWFGQQQSPGFLTAQGLQWRSTSSEWAAVAGGDPVQAVKK